MQISVAAGDGLVRGFYFESTAAEARAVSAAPGTAGQTRQDYVILKLDLTGNTITLEVKAGTANGSGGALPSLTQNSTTWEHPIGRLTIPNGLAAIAAGNIQVLGAGIGMRVIPYPDTTQRPTPATGIKALGLNTTTKVFEYWGGSSWVSLAPAAPEWGDIGSKPTTFPPSSHSHAISDITDLSTQLSGKAPTSHNHTISQISDIASASVANAVKVGGRTIFVQSGTPSGAVSGDLWFW